jgi:hypothetical protein
LINELRLQENAKFQNNKKLFYFKFAAYAMSTSNLMLVHILVSVLNIELRSANNAEHFPFLEGSLIQQCGTPVNQFTH